MLLLIYLFFFVYLRKRNEYFKAMKQNEMKKGEKTKKEKNGKCRFLYKEC